MVWTQLNADLFWKESGEASSSENIRRGFTFWTLNPRGTSLNLIQGKKVNSAFQLVLKPKSKPAKAFFY